MKKPKDLLLEKLMKRISKLPARERMIEIHDYNHQKANFGRKGD